MPSAKLPAKTATKKSASGAKPVEEEDVLHFEVKRHHFYAALIPVGFLAGLLVGYLAWGQGPGAGANSASVADTVASANNGDIVSQRYDIPINADDPVLGSADAPITIIEFADFQCPYCQRHAQETYPQLQANYGDKIRFVYKDFPLSSIHPQAFPAALASHCAQEQGQFWEYHDLLFSGQQELGDDAYTAYAEQLGLNMNDFNACYQDQKYTDQVQTDYNYAVQLGVSSTPTFFINGIAVIGAQPYSVFSQIIDYELQNKGS